MTNEDIIRMAREAGCLGPGKGGDPNGLWEPNGEENVTELMFRFAALVRADERERIAAEWDGHMYGDTEDIDIGAAIRARSKE